MEIKYKYFNELDLKKRGYGFMFMLYPDSEEYDTERILNFIRLQADDNIKYYAYILHDKEESKPHYHVAIKYENQKAVQTVLNDLCLWNYNPNENDIIIHDWYGALNYLIHNTKDSRDKYQYPETEVKSNIPETINNLRISKDKTDIFLEICDFITDPCKNTIRYKDVIEYCKSKDIKYIRVLLDRQVNFTISNLIKERNVI